MKSTIFSTLRFLSTMKLRYFYCTYKLAIRGYTQVAANNRLNLKSEVSSFSKTLKKYVPSSLTEPSQATSYSTESLSKCWRCNSDQIPLIFCSNCNALQELHKDFNYFKLIGINEDYDVDTSEVNSKYRRLQNLLHPDRFSNSSEKEKELSENLSSLVNKAHSTLLHPLKRGLYMLRLNNLDIPEGSTALNPTFLMEIMEKNEEIEAATVDPKKVLELIKENRKILGESSRQVSAAFQRKDMEEARRILIEMKYYASIEAKLKALKQDLGIVE
ncbi:iron-sulfur cluster co-chaperone protein HscB isoform X2 [Athalia rosae]|uniref:iron-sulfur cluster co-chaperone protein HscB isoform X2 n=1 Tax=Athalia rosae TaxID=37344 RepID=UPI002034466E|nr:iron-sulfur cluster co-chaperone protein HscB isoform X2 [Athalia rosae]